MKIISIVAITVIWLVTLRDFKKSKGCNTKPDRNIPRPPAPKGARPHD